MIPATRPEPPKILKRLVNIYLAHGAGGLSAAVLQLTPSELTTIRQYTLDCNSHLGGSLELKGVAMQAAVELFERGYLARIGEFTHDDPN